MIRFYDQTDYFELDIASQEGSASPAEGDAYMIVNIVSAGFVGHNNSWVDARSLRNFCSDLLQLTTKRQGQARIKGMSPKTMDITVRSIDSTGHMIVEGTIGCHVQRERGPRPHSLTFGIEFEPSQLNDVERASWVKQNAEQAYPFDHLRP